MCIVDEILMSIPDDDFLPDPDTYYETLHDAYEDLKAYGFICVHSLDELSSKEESAIRDITYFADVNGSLYYVTDYALRNLTPPRGDMPFWYYVLDSETEDYLINLEKVFHSRYCISVLVKAIKSKQIFVKDFFYSIQIISDTVPKAREIFCKLVNTYFPSWKRYPRIEFDETTFNFVVTSGPLDLFEFSLTSNALNQKHFDLAKLFSTFINIYENYPVFNKDHMIVMMCEFHKHFTTHTSFVHFSPLNDEAMLRRGIFKMAYRYHCNIRTDKTKKPKHHLSDDRIKLLCDALAIT